MKNNFLILLVSAAALSFACENDNTIESSITIDEFSVIPEKDTVPCKINIIYTSSSKGLNNYLFIHKGAYFDKEFIDHRDTTNMTSMSTEEISRTDTLEIYYNEAGSYQITLEVNSEVYEDGIELFSKK